MLNVPKPLQIELIDKQDISFFTMFRPDICCPLYVSWERWSL
jgi:hypothetical protein